jgi:hypothetical protein
VYVIVPVEVGILIGVLVSSILFVRLAVSAGTVRSLQFQLALFLSIWTISEIPRVLDSIGVIDLSPIRLYGAMVHTVSMVLFGLFIGYRFSRFVLRGGK